MAFQEMVLLWCISSNSWWAIQRSKRWYFFGAFRRTVGGQYTSNTNSNDSNSNATNAKATSGRTKTHKKGKGRKSSQSSNNQQQQQQSGQLGAFFLIKNLDTGKEFVVKEFAEDGMWNRLSDLQTGRQMTMEEYEKSVGYSPVVKELMRSHLDPNPLNIFRSKGDDKGFFVGNAIDENLSMDLDEFVYGIASL